MTFVFKFLATLNILVFKWLVSTSAYDLCKLENICMRRETQTDSNMKKCSLHLLINFSSKYHCLVVRLITIFEKSSMDFDALHCKTHSWLIVRFYCFDNIGIRVVTAKQFMSFYFMGS